MPREGFKEWTAILAGLLMLSGGPGVQTSEGSLRAGVRSSERVNRDRAMDEVIVLELLAGATALERRYGLGVRPVPTPPDGLLAATEILPHGCPLELRAIVEAEQASDSFAVVAVLGAADTEVLYRGDRFRTGGARWTLTRIAPDSVLLRQGDAVVSCKLSSR